MVLPYIDMNQPWVYMCSKFFSSLLHKFLISLFDGPIYCTLFLLDCFDFAYGCICICVYSVTLFTVVINLCLYIRLFQFCGVFLFFFFLSSSRFFSSFLFFIISIFNFLKPIIFFYIYSFVFLSYRSFPL